MALQETIYLDRDNSIKLGMLADGTAVDARTFTRVVAKLTNDAGVVSTFDSNVSPAAFDFTSETAQVGDTVTGILVLKLQDAAAPPVPGNDYVLDLIVYDAANSNGLNWSSPFPVRVVSG